MSAIALLSILLAFALQGLGYTGTCTQGANGPFLTGAFLSLPLLALSAALLGTYVAQSRRGRYPNGSVINGTASFGAAIVAVWMAFANSAVAHDTLWLGTGPCGPSYTPVGQFDGPNLIVGIAFAVLPMLIAPLATLTFWTALPPSRSA